MVVDLVNKIKEGTIPSGIFIPGALGEWASHSENPQITDTSFARGLR
jgi:hypothetical protein